ncbi:glycosyltransferase family 2 protein [Chryseobacterium sp. GMJ5]|uniref:Glycosyltransferase family 2 protein n=1 Tax=Chryseobacterium gilvum TaxID=2976534 RepID=A0ABT2VYJ6_9FLAO|nr:glycosyltransferase family 2 protein [Chryseobacterium gilvum]MCU7615073.1 glycosyltransferase family 2 protein [Chryseobacterium gilvum]
MINVAILLSTYNGDQFLKQQINSILEQSYTNWDLYIRDDSSSDNTVKIIEEYSIRYHNIHFIKDSYRKGACKSFLYLLENINSDYYMFCDQDDIWLPEKIQMSVKKIQQAEAANSNIPILVHTDLKVVDQELTEIYPSFWKYSKLKQQFLSKFNYLGVCNGVTGCTVIINNKAKEVSLPLKKEVPMHDYWIALKVAQMGKIIYINTPTILYRQHSKNEVGAKKTNNAYFILQLKKIKKTINNQLQMYQFLKEIEYGSLLKFYWYKITYTIIRNI